VLTLLKLVSGKASIFPDLLQDLLRGDSLLPPPVPHHDWREDIPRSKVDISFFNFKKQSAVRGQVVVKLIWEFIL
jgi:hypothetical protein